MNSETPVKDIIDGEAEVENTVEVDAAEQTVTEQIDTVTDVIEEAEEIIPEVKEPICKKEKKVYSPALNMMASKKALAPFVVGFASVCLMAFGYFLMWIFNLAIPKLGAFSNTGMIKTFLGRTMASLIHSIVFAFAIVAIVAFIKICVMGKNGLGKNLKNINRLNNCMFIFSMFSMVDMGVVFIVSVLKHNYWVINRTLEFMGYSRIYAKSYAKVQEPEKGGVGLSIVYSILCIAAPIALAICYNAIKEYINKLKNSADGAQFDKGNKAPFVFAIVAATINFLFAVVAFASGVFVDGIIFLSTFAYMVANAIYVKSIHKDMLSTSVD